MGFAEGFLQGRALKLQQQKAKQEEKLNNLKIQEAVMKLGMLQSQAKSQNRLLQPDSGPLPGQEGPPAPNEMGILERLSQGQADTTRDAIRSGMLQELQNLQKVQQGPAPFSPEGKEIADIFDLARRKGENSEEVGALLKKFDVSGTGAPKLSDIGSLRSQYINQSKDNFVALSSFEKISALAQDPTGAGDVGMIFAFMKQLDPGSRVTEGEVALAGQVSGAASQFLNLYNRLVKGERLSPTARQDILFQAANLAKTTAADQKANDKTFGGVATRSKMDPRDVAIFRERLQRIEGAIKDTKKPNRSLSQTAKNAENSLSQAKEFLGGLVGDPEKSEEPNVEQMDLNQLLEFVSDPNTSEDMLDKAKEQLERLRGG